MPWGDIPVPSIPKRGADPSVPSRNNPLHPREASPPLFPWEACSLPSFVGRCAIPLRPRGAARLSPREDAVSRSVSDRSFVLHFHLLTGAPPSPEGRRRVRQQGVVEHLPGPTPGPGPRPNLLCASSMESASLGDNLSRQAGPSIPSPTLPPPVRGVVSNTSNDKEQSRDNAARPVTRAQPTSPRIPYAPGCSTEKLSG